MTPNSQPSRRARWPKITEMFALAGAMLLTGVVSRVTDVNAAPVYNTPVVLGAAGSYSVLSGASVFNTTSAPGTPHTIVRGDLGVSSSGAITGFPPGEVTGTIHSNDTHASDAQSALTTAYTNAFARTPTNSVSGDLVGLTLAPGVHHSAGAVSNSGLLRLDGQGNSSAVFVIQIDGALTFGASTEVRLINGAQASRVFWQVGGAVGVAANATVIGTFMVQNAISLGDGVIIDGRMLARTGAITMNNTFVDISPPVGTTRFTGTFPIRLADTRSDTGWYAPLSAGKVLRIPVANTMGIPADVTAAALNVTAVGPSAPGYLAVYPCTAQPPTTSTVNFIVGHDVANSTIATLATDGHVCIYASVAVNVLVDITGWFTPGGATAMTPVNSVRVTDTRIGLGGSPRLQAGSVIVVDTGQPAASAVALNVTASAASAAGHLTVYPCGTPPNISTVNFTAGEDRPNNTIVATSTGGLVCIFASVAVDVVVDVTGAFSAGGQLDYLPAQPTRLLDTRPGKVAAGTQIEFVVPAAELPSPAASVNVTAVLHTANGYTTAFKCATIPPNASTVNQRIGEANANGAIVELGAGLNGCLFTSSTTSLIVDLNGWWVVIAP